MNIENQYLELAKNILENGNPKSDRTGTGTISLFGAQLRADLSDGFPLLTTKKLYTRAIIHELLWFISGVTNVKYLQDNNVRIWNEWADENGNLGPVYGKQWRDWNGIDQLKEAIDLIRNDPNSRRIIVNSWNVSALNSMALHPCHCMYQFYVANGKLSCQLYQRSADLFLGVPFNIASYALLTHMVAQVCNLEVGDFVHTFGDVHIYNNHVDQVKEQLSRKPIGFPELVLNKHVKNIDDFSIDDVKISGYNPHPTIKAEISV